MDNEAILARQLQLDDLRHEDEDGVEMVCKGTDGIVGLRLVAGLREVRRDVKGIPRWK